MNYTGKANREERINRHTVLLAPKCRFTLGHHLMDGSRKNFKYIFTLLYY